jgi:hypothetical protein
MQTRRVINPGAEAECIFPFSSDRRFRLSGDQRLSRFLLNGAGEDD